MSEYYSQPGESKEIAKSACTADQGAGLIDKLQQVQNKIDNGGTAAACNQLGSFINQVNAFLKSGSLTGSQGQALINAANAIKASLGCWARQAMARRLRKHGFP